jgi:hypothetical protein
VILACRSLEKAEAARAELVERTGKDPFDVLAVDTSEVASNPSNPTHVGVRCRCRRLPPVEP